MQIRSFPSPETWRGSAGTYVNTELTYELCRLPTLKSALFAVGRALGEREMGRVNVVFVRQAAVDGLTRYLFVPLPICTCYCHRRVRLENKTRVKDSAHHYDHEMRCSMQISPNQRGR